MNALSLLQQSVINRLTVTDATVPSLVPENGAINWITEDIGDLANIITRTTGSVGIVGIVLTPGGGKLFSPSGSGGAFPISFNCPIEIQIQENVTVNRGVGTNIPSLDLVVFCWKRLHLWSPSHQRNNRIEADETPFILVSEAPILTYNVRFNTPITIT